jgi:transcriptional regulator with GAF, ATPase, and Fis domain
MHNSSPRAGRPLIAVNCAAIPETLLESELFGHEKGAFTGAGQRRIGHFERANGGTLFLDEIGELGMPVQAKLLRFLQEREFQRVGGERTLKADVRIISATHKKLGDCVETGQFRQDLYYRLNVIPLHLPPLRERTEDIPLLVETFLQENLKKRKREPLKFSPEAMACYSRYEWPGNVRELKNLVERLTILVNGNVVKLSDLPDKFQQGRLFDLERTENGHKRPPVGSADIPEEGIDLNSIVDSMERDLILKALEKTGGVRSRAATLLGLNRTTLIEKMKKMGIEFRRA